MKYSLLLLLFPLFFTACSSGSSTPQGPISGGKVFSQYCTTCHGANGKAGVNGAKDLTASTLSIDERINVITNGRQGANGAMASFKGLLSAEEIKAVAEYTMSLK